MNAPPVFWYYVSKQQWTIAVGVVNGLLTITPPIVRWAVGKPLRTITNGTNSELIGVDMLMCRQFTLPAKRSCKYRTIPRNGTLVTIGRSTYFITYILKQQKWAVLKRPCTLLGIYSFNDAFDAIKQDEKGR